MDYEKKYKEALERAKYLKENTDGVGALDISACFEEIFPELKESEDERIKNEIIAFVEQSIHRGGGTPIPQEQEDKWIAWLEKQCEKTEPIEGFNTEFERQISHLIASTINKEYDYTKDFVKWTSGTLLNYAKHELEKQGEQKPYMIQWKGDNLKEVIGFTGKNKNFDKWFTSFEEYERYVHEHNNIFKLFNEDGSHYEVPIGAWIVKTPDGYNVASNAIFKPKSDGKVETKFKVGDWITNGEYTWKVTDIKPLDYILQSQNGDAVDDTISYVDEEFHLWTIQDAKNGDVLMANAPFIFNGNLEGGIGCPGAHCGINTLGKFQIPKYQEHWTGHTTTPANKEQHDLLFSKMEEAGYEWDAEKKELKKIEKESTWSEEDESMLTRCIGILGKCYMKELPNKVEEELIWLKSIKSKIQPNKEWSKEDSERLLRIHQFIWANRKGDTDEIYQQEQDADWLMSLNPQQNNYDKGYNDGYSAEKYNQWKPSVEQLKTLWNAICYVEDDINSNFVGGCMLESLYKDLKKL